MIVNEVMKTAVATCAPETDLGAVIEIMRDRDCGSLPVVDSHGIVVCVVTDRDVCMAAGTKHRPLARASANETIVPSGALLFRGRERQDRACDEGETPKPSVAGLKKERTPEGRLVERRHHADAASPCRTRGRGHRLRAESNLRPSSRRSGDRVSDWNARAAVLPAHEMKADHLRTFGVPAYSSEIAPLASTRLDRWALARIQWSVTSAPICFMLWDGFELPSTAGPAVATILFKNRPALLSWVWDPELNFGEAYMSGAVEIRGDLLALLEAIYRALGTSTRRPWWLWQKSNDARAARENVHHHYDMGNEFYRLWLDRDMVYTCAYFQTPDATLEEAQIAKMDLVCRKLQLQPGERVIEAGCGWGSLALFMAKHYDVTVQGFNISAEQIAYARNRAKDEGLVDRVEFIEDDYRNVRGTYDVFLSIGMLEHVGRPDYPTLGRVIDRSLTDRGRGLLHFIGRNQAGPLNPWIRKRIFPGAYAPTLREVFEHVLEPQALSVLDVENLRLHYAKTLECWRQRFEGSSHQVATIFDDTFVRAWRLYLAGSEAAFTTGWMQLFQVLFARGSSNAIPWTRISG